ncbi:peptidase [Vibrio sp. DW001]|uniref:helix-turn-helix domain-containing protein n=1 Tax=Vibrio sp. DW001 TaxID=2912315 RepID=UPI0023B1A82C|nr:S24 family peptidase [Vibrio sp. DW001]WED28132.1 peptidase [Vibrio sp. DW001]
MREWFLSTELLELDGVPSSTTGIAQKANRNNWLKRKAVGRGKAFEYHFSNFHADVQKQIIEKYITTPDDLKSSDYGEIDKDKAYESIIRQLNERAKTYESNASEMIPLSHFEKWSKLPVYDVYAAAGAGSLVQTEYQIGTFHIPTELLNEFGLDDKNSSIIFVDGDSMEPTLSHKDRLLVDIRETQHPVSNGVYVIRIDDAVYVKRLSWDIANGLYNVISDNLKYSAFQINHNNGRNFKIIGKAVTIVMKPIL